jgi:hypothetical protein
MLVLHIYTWFQKKDDGNCEIYGYAFFSSEGRKGLDHLG